MLAEWTAVLILMFQRHSSRGGPLCSRVHPAKAWDALRTSVAFRGTDFLLQGHNLMSSLLLHAVLEQAPAEGTPMGRTFVWVDGSLMELNSVVICVNMLLLFFSLSMMNRIKRTGILLRGCLAASKHF